mgnify:CR=1 FL=1
MQVLLKHGMVRLDPKEAVPTVLADVRAPSDLAGQMPPPVGKRGKGKKGRR